MESFPIDPVIATKFLQENYQVGSSPGFTKYLMMELALVE